MTARTTARVIRFPKLRANCLGLEQRGYHAVYRGDGSDRCPGCGRQHWIVGRLSAECAFCATALMKERP